MNAFVNSAEQEDVFEVLKVTFVCDKAELIDSQVHIELFLSKADEFFSLTDDDEIRKDVQLT
jgi:hypothetical protein